MLMIMIILMTLRETFLAIKLLTSELSSNEQYPWIIQYFYKRFNA
jgi:hypothetical protein